MPSKSQLHFPILKKYTVFIIIIIIIITTTTTVSSYDQNEAQKSTSVCKSVLLENCTGDKCITNISVINKCPSDFPVGEIKKKCENFVDADLLKDTFLFIPVTNKLKNTTYWNTYCALCNQEDLKTDNFTFWTLGALHVREASNYSKPIHVDSPESFESNVDLAVLEKMQVPNDAKLLISKFHDLVYKVVLLRYLPSELRNSSYQLCSSDMSDNSIEFLMKNNTGRFPPAPENFNCAWTKFCSRRKIPQRESCVYFDSNVVPCDTNEFYVEGVDFVYNKHQVIRTDGEILDLDNYSNLSEVSNVIFFCKRKDAEKLISKEMIEFIKYMKYISTFLLFVFLVMKASKKNFRSLPNLILYSYCLASLGVYLYQIFCYMIADRLILRSYLLFYVHLSHAFWAAIISYEYWYVISLALRYEKPRHVIRKYRIYGAIGWILPALILCAAYLSLSEEDKAAFCPLIPHHIIINVTEHLSGLAHDLHVALYFLYGSVYLVLIPFVAIQGCFFIRLARNSREIEERSAERLKNKTCSTTELDYLFIFTKIAYLMGIHWMILFVALILSFFDFNLNLNNVFPILFACHGTFISLAFTFTRTERKRYTSSYKSFVSRSFRSTRVESLSTVEGSKVNEQD